jgi:rod shape-determining protein MreC
MNAILRDPPAFFNRGPSPLARLTFFGLLAVVLMIADHHFKAVDSLRVAIGAAVEPIQRAAAWPVRATTDVLNYFGDQHRLLAENENLKRRVAEYAREAQATRLLRAEQTLLTQATGNRYAEISTPAEVLYYAKRAGSHKLIIDRGLTQGVKPGMIVINDTGIVGQITQAGPTTSALTLATAKDQSIPIMIERSGMRAIAVGTGDAGALDLPFLPGNAELRTGDRVVTSGIDGLYPAGLIVGDIESIDRNAGYTYPKVRIKPASSVGAHRLVMVLNRLPQDEYPTVDIPAAEANKKTKGRPTGATRDPRRPAQP